MRAEQRIAPRFPHLPGLEGMVRQKHDVIARIHAKNIRQIAFGDFSCSCNHKLLRHDCQDRFPLFFSVFLFHRRILGVLSYS